MQEKKKKKDCPTKSEFEILLEKLEKLEVPESQCSIDDDEECLSCGS